MTALQDNKQLACEPGLSFFSDMKITALLSLFLVAFAFVLGGCATQQTEEVNYGYGVEMEENSDADQAEVLTK